MEMGKEIRRLRIDRGITQDALASALNVTAQSVSKWECGTSVPDVQLLPEIAIFFGVSIDQLFAMDPEQQMERIGNRICDNGMFDEAEERQLEKQLNTFAENPAYKGKAELLLTQLYNHQADQYRLLAVEHGKIAAEETKGDREALGELALAWGSYVPDWDFRNRHALIEWFGDYCRKNPNSRAAVMWLLDNLIADRRLKEAREWIKKLAAIDDTFRVNMYRYQIAEAAGEKEEAETQIKALESMADTQEWCCATTLGDIYTQRQEYDRAIEWYKKGQEIQPSPKYTDSARSIAHICEIRGDKEGAIAAYKEELRLMKEEWGIISGEERDEVIRAIQKLQA